MKSTRKMRIDLDIAKNIEQNAGDCFEKAKKAKKKIAGAMEAIADLKKRIDVLKKKQSVEDEKEKEKEKPQRDRHWYEKFRWFKTSDGFLVVGGRDATTNEIVIKKHTDADDLVFHTDMAGSPFFVLKTEGKKPSKAAISEAADATCSFSRAWKLGLSAQSVFYVKPEQVSKTAMPGEYLVKGSFMIYGKTTYVDNKINAAIGMMDDGALMGGPLDAVKKHCKKFVVLEQGDEKPSAAAKKIKNKIGGELDDIIRVMPPGNVKVKDDR